MYAWDKIQITGDTIINKNDTQTESNNQVVSKLHYTVYQDDP